MSSLLVVDDEPTVLHLFRRMFDKVGIEVLTAASAAEARRLVAETRPDVAILDLVLPDQTGLQAFQALKEIDPRLPVIFMTASGQGSRPRFPRNLVKKLGKIVIANTDYALAA
jgi:two-component system nitrogen regulation response regulator GlnG